MKSVGIIGIGTHLPPTVRTNEWWPADVVAQWTERMAARATNGTAPDPSKLTSGGRRTLAAMQALASDPFRGIRERRIMTDDTTTSHMEAIAGKQALQRAGITPADVDVVLAQTPCPEYPLVNNAAIAHQLLELPQRCLSIGTEVACNSFAVHTTMAQALIASGQARYVLSLHSCALTRVHGPVEPHSAWWGDGAAAVVYGPVSDGRGIRAVTHDTDGRQYDAIVLGVPGKRYWFEDGAVTTLSNNRDATRSMLFGMVDRGAASLREAIAKADLAPSAIEYFACHQSTPWLAPALVAEAGMERAEAPVTFPMLGHMGPVSVPYILAEGERSGKLRDGSVFATFTGGAGETWSGVVCRWGR